MPANDLGLYSNLELGRLGRPRHGRFCGGFCVLVGVLWKSGVALSKLPLYLHLYNGSKSWNTTDGQFDARAQKTAVIVDWHGPLSAVDGCFKLVSRKLDKELCAIFFTEKMRECT